MQTDPTDIHGAPEALGLEVKSLASGEKRVKYSSTWSGEIDEVLANSPRDRHTYETLVTGMAEALWEQERMGVAPVMADGKVGGNASVRCSLGAKEYLITSKSGRLGGKIMDTRQDVCLVSAFNMQGWAAVYRSASRDILPTSDLPLHYATMAAAQRFHWSEKPDAVLHGHALETEEDAHRLDIPISKKETLFSTAEDTEALLELYEKYPYPENNIYIRKGHGFVILGSSMEDTLHTFKQKMKSHQNGNACGLAE